MSHRFAFSMFILVIGGLAAQAQSQVRPNDQVGPNDLQREKDVENYYFDWTQLEDLRKLDDPTDEIRKLQIERLGICIQELKISQIELMGMRGPIDYDVAERAIKAALDLAKTREQKISSYQLLLRMWQGLEDDLKKEIELDEFGPGQLPPPNDNFGRLDNTPVDVSQLQPVQFQIRSAPRNLRKELLRVQYEIYGVRIEILKLQKQEGENKNQNTE